MLIKNFAKTSFCIILSSSQVLFSATLQANTTYVDPYAALSPEVAFDSTVDPDNSQLAEGEESEISSLSDMDTALSEPTGGEQEAIESPYTLQERDESVAGSYRRIYYDVINQEGEVITSILKEQSFGSATSTLSRTTLATPAISETGKLVHVYTAWCTRTSSSCVRRQVVDVIDVETNETLDSFQLQTGTDHVVESSFVSRKADSIHLVFSSGKESTLIIHNSKSLRTTHQLRPGEREARNWSNQYDERWFTDNEEKWHYILPDGRVYRWDSGTRAGMIHADTLIGKLFAEDHANLQWLNPELPEGWQRAASNPDFAFREVVTQVPNSNLYSNQLQLWDIRELEDSRNDPSTPFPLLRVVGQIYTQAPGWPDAYDVSPDGTTLVMGSLLNASNLPTDPSQHEPVIFVSSLNVYGKTPLVLKDRGTLETITFVENTLFIQTTAAATLAADLVTLEEVNLDNAATLVFQLGLFAAPDDARNWSGIHDERWFRGSGNNTWYYILPDGRVYLWASKSKAGMVGSDLLVTQLTTAHHADLSWLEGLLPVPEGYTRTASNPDYAYRLEMAGYTVQRPGSKVQNIYILDLRTGEEKSIGASDHLTHIDISPDGSSVVYSWHIPEGAQTPFVIPQSGVRVYDLGTGQAKTIEITDGEVTAIQFSETEAGVVHVNVSNLTTRRINLETLFYSAGQLKEALNLYSTGSDSRNWSGTHDERWFKGEGNQWYYILPDGRVYRWDSNTKAGMISGDTLVAVLDSSAHASFDWLA